MYELEGGTLAAHSSRPSGHLVARNRDQGSVQVQVSPAAIHSVASDIERFVSINKHKVVGVELIRDPVPIQPSVDKGKGKAIEDDILDRELILTLSDRA